MAGNITEWVKDLYHGDYTDAPTDGSAWMGHGMKCPDDDDDVMRIHRGGTWGSTGIPRLTTRLLTCTSASWPQLGFRCVR